MSAFNVLSARATCPNCNHRVDFEVQFKYGDTWQHSYRLGDTVRWGGNQIGVPGRRKVLVEGVGGPCPDCGKDCIDFDLLIENDKLVRVESVRGIRKDLGREGFVVLEP